MVKMRSTCKQAREHANKREITYCCHPYLDWWSGRVNQLAYVLPMAVHEQTHHHTHTTLHGVMRATAAGGCPYEGRARMYTIKDPATVCSINPTTGLPDATGLGPRSANYQVRWLQVMQTAQGGRLHGLRVS